jgi:small subunit ribosomal protein S20
VANHKNALKAHRQSLKRRDHNRQLLSRMRHALKSIRTALDDGDPTKAKDALRSTVSLIDKMAGKGLIHRNAAARHKARLSKRLAKPSATA